MIGYKATGSELERTFFLALLADALLRRGSLREAADVLNEALIESQKTGVHFHLAELHRLQGEAILRMSNGSRERAKSCFNRALQVARNQRTKSLELRAAVSLARLWRNQGRDSEARRVLAPVYGWFTEGFHTSDLREAKSVLDTIE
jgi:predicted ATPase